MDLTLHLGLHRTGTTALQQMLRRHAGRLAAEGTAVLGPRRLRDEALRAARRAWRSGEGRGASPLAGVIADAAQGCGHVILSEENLLGSMHVNLREAALYPNAPRRLAELAAELPAAPDRIFLTLRDYAAYWRSAQAHVLLEGSERAVRAVRLVRASAEGWTPLLRAIRAAFPSARLLVARHRADAGFVPALATALLGTDALWGVTPPRTTVNASLPAEVIARLCSLQRGPERSRLAEASRRAGLAPVEVFSPSEAAALRQAFEAEWQAICAGAVPGVEVLALAVAEPVP